MTDVRDDDFNARNAPGRFAARNKDPWARLFDVEQSITAAMRKRLQ